MKLTPLIGTAPLSEKVDSAATQTKLLGVKNSTKWPWRPLHGQPGKGWHWLTLGGWVTIREWHFGWHWVRLSVWQVECCQGMRTSSSKRTIHNAPFATWREGRQCWNQHRTQSFSNVNPRIRISHQSAKSKANNEHFPAAAESNS